jgi:hypothetical protein
MHSQPVAPFNAQKKTAALTEITRRTISHFNQKNIQTSIMISFQRVYEKNIWEKLGGDGACLRAVTSEFAE